MNHVLCSRCGAALEHLVALLGHYQEVHGGVPKPRFRDMEEIREVVPDHTRADEHRRMRMVHYYHGTGRLLGGKWAS